MPQEHYAFVDEFGDENLSTEVDGASTYFIMTALLVPKAALQQARAGVDQVRARFFSSGEIKSSSIGSNHRRRLRVLDALAPYVPPSLSLAVDKRQLDRDSGGLRWKRAFRKYLNGQLYRRLFSLHDHVSVIADQHGHADFMEQLKAYIARTLPAQLFGQRNFDLVDSKEEPLIQAADMVAGSWARVVDPEKRAPNAIAIRDKLRASGAEIAVWPLREMPGGDSVSDLLHEQDQVVRDHCVRQAHLFLDEHREELDDEVVGPQVALLDMLCFEALFTDSHRYISTGELRDRLLERGVALSERRFRQVVSSLRDSGVVIGSSSAGYKLPMRLADVRDFVAHARSIVPQMLRRLMRARSDLSLATDGDVDILGGEDNAQLRHITDALQGWGA